MLCGRIFVAMNILSMACFGNPWKFKLWIDEKYSVLGVYFWNFNFKGAH